VVRSLGAIARVELELFDDALDTPVVPVVP
jgi:hypothetical protein